MFNSPQAVADRLQIQPTTKVLDLGGTAQPFAFGDVTLVDIVAPPTSSRARFVKLDLCRQTLPFKDREFDVCIASHILEDLYNPFICLDEIRRVASRGYIETPHRGREVSLTQGSGHGVPGWGHHRWSFEDAGPGRFRVIAKTWHLVRDDALKVARWRGPDCFGFFWDGSYSYEVLNTLDEHGDHWERLVQEHNEFVRQNAQHVELAR